MPVTNAVFDFAGMDVTTDTSVAAPGAQSATLTEQGITFSFTAQAGTGLSNFSSTFAALSVSQGTVTLDINDIPDEEFFSNLVLDFSSISGAFSGTNSVVLVRSKTSLGAPLATNVVTTITNAQITSNAIVTAPAGQWNTIQFKSTGFMILEDLTATVNCFLPGTRIATPDGETPVEDLANGDLIATAGGKSARVKWVGHQDINTTLAHPAKVNPVCITAGAMGDGLPRRDLYVSADHAIAIDGTLYNAGALTNGSTIYQVATMPKDGFTYYHVETEAHDLLLAEGVPAETFIDYAGRDWFKNADEAGTHTITEMDLPRVSSPRLVPDHIRARLSPASIAAE